MKEGHIILREFAPSDGGSRFEAHAQGSAYGDAASRGERRFQLESDKLDARQVAEVARDPDVKVIAPFMPMKLIEPYESLNDGVRTTNKDGEVAWGVKAVGASSSPYTGEGIVVAVLDTGIDADHPAFAGVELVTKNFTDGLDGDTHGHGTHCAGTIFGRNVKGTRIGVAPGIRKVLIGKVLGAGGGSSETIISAMQWAVNNGAQIISMSLGIDFPGYQLQLTEQGLPPIVATSRALEGYRKNVALFERLASLMSTRELATVLIAAAGNESNRSGVPSYEIAASPPAVSDGFVSVGAVGQAGDKLKVAPFSNTGPLVCGPGVDIVSAAIGGGLSTMSGTSMATPHAVGVAALWAQKMSKTSTPSSKTLTANLIGRATMDSLGEGFDPASVGNGIVFAPQV